MKGACVQTDSLPSVFTHNKLRGTRVQTHSFQAKMHVVSPWLLALLYLFDAPVSDQKRTFDVCNRNCVCQVASLTQQLKELQTEQEEQE